MNRDTLITLAILISLCLSLTFGGCSGGGGGGSSDDGQVYVEKSFSFENVVDTQDRFVIRAIGGSIGIDGSPAADTVTIEGERRVGSKSRDDAGRHLEMLEVEVTNLNSEIIVETIQPRIAGGRNYEVHYRITVPDYMEVQVIQVAGPVFIDAIGGAVDVNTVKGDVDLTEITGSARISVITGHIYSQVSLPLNGAIDFSTVTGDIDCEVALPSGDTIDMTALKGDINLDIPENTSAIFTAWVIKGDIRLFNLELQNQTRSPHSITGTLGDGKGDIWLDTEAGDITVTGF